MTSSGQRAAEENCGLPILHLGAKGLYDTSLLIKKKVPYITNKTCYTMQLLTRHLYCLQYNTITDATTRITYFIMQYDFLFYLQY